MIKKMARSAAGGVALLCATIAPSAADFDSAFYHQEVDFSAYHSIVLIVDEVIAENAANPNSAQSVLGDSYMPTERDIQSQSNQLRRLVTQRLEKKFDLVEQAGEGVLVVNLVMTGLLPSKPTASHLGNQRRGMIDYASSSFRGGAAMHLDLIDGGDGKVIATFQDAQFRGAMSAGGAKPTTWYDARRAFIDWSQELEKQLNSSGGGS